MAIIHEGKILDRDERLAFADLHGIPRNLMDVLHTCLPAMMVSRDMIERSLLKTGWCDTPEEAECMVERMWNLTGRMRREREAAGLDPVTGKGGEHK